MVSAAMHCALSYISVICCDVLHHAMVYFAALCWCCAVLCCAVLCCAVLCCAVLCCCGAAAGPCLAGLAVSQMVC